MISTLFSSLIPVFKLYWAVKVGRQRKYYSSYKPNFILIFTCTVGIPNLYQSFFFWQKVTGKLDVLTLLEFSHGFVVVFYCCPCHVLCSWTLWWILTEVSLFFSVSELTCSLEESLDELQVLKRKNTAHIRVNRFSWNFCNKWE